MVNNVGANDGIFLFRLLIYSGAGFSMGSRSATTSPTGSVHSTPTHSVKPNTLDPFADIGNLGGSFGGQFYRRTLPHSHLYVPYDDFLFSSGGSGFSSKPTTPTGPTPFMPPMGSPSRPPASPQHTAGFPSWQPGPGSGGGWQPQGQGTPPQPKPSPSHTPMSHNSPQNRPNYNVSFSAMGGGSPSAGNKAQAGMGEQEMINHI